MLEITEAFLLSIKNNLALNRSNYDEKEFIEIVTLLGNAFMEIKKVRAKEAFMSIVKPKEPT